MILEELIWEIIYNPIEEMGYRVVRIKKGIDGSKNLQIMAERLKDQKLDINDCVKISKHVKYTSKCILIICFLNAYMMANNFHSNNLGSLSSII